MDPEYLAEIRPAWRRNWLASIRELSNSDWHRRYWGKSDNPHHSFDEYVTVYWDDVLGGQGYGPFVADELLSRDEASTCSDLHSELDQYLTANPSSNNESVVGDPEWGKIVTAADRARTALLSIIADPDERRELMRDEPEFQ